MEVDAVDGVSDKKARRRQLAVVTLLICELCLVVLNARTWAAALQSFDPIDEWLPLGALKAVEAAPDQFNAPGPLRFSLKGAKFDRTAANVILTVNGVRVTPRHIKISAHRLATDVRLIDGANLISLRAYDAIGRTLHYNHTVWCGNWTLGVELAAADGSPVREVSTIAVTIPGDDTVRQEQMTNRGTATFRNLPAHKLVIHVRSTDGAEATAETFGSAGIVRVTVLKSST